jgi:hypothetical protein
MSVRITCITKANGNHENPYVAISYLGWVEDGSTNTGSTPRERMYDWIKNEKGVAYVLDRFGNKAFLIPEISPRGTKYVKTVPDQTKTDNLLQLPECR